jgi:hypothetical protein
MCPSARPRTWSMARAASSARRNLNHSVSILFLASSVLSRLIRQMKFSISALINVNFRYFSRYSLIFAKTHYFYITKLE